MPYLKRLLLISTLLSSIFAHPQFRKVKCSTFNGSAYGGPTRSKCTLVLKDTEEEEPGRNAPEEAGCFLGDASSGEEDRVYCDLVCPKAHAVFQSKSLRHKSCFKFYTYGLEQRGENWLLWRSGKCLNSTVTLDIGCKFDAPFSTQFDNDKEVFEHLKRRVVA